MARKSPAFSFYADSWIGGTMRMPPLQRAAYIDLMANQWLEGPFTLEVALMVSRGVPEKEVKAVLQSKFVHSNGLYYNERLEQERKKQIANSDKQSRNGKKGGRPPKNEKPKTNPIDNPSKTQSNSQAETQTEAIKKLSDSDSDSDSVLVLDPESNSDSDSGGEKSPPAHIGDYPKVPFGLLQAWRKWEGFILESQGAQIGSIETETTLMSLLRRGEEKAIRDIEFSIIKRCKTIRDSDNDYDKPSKSGPRCPQVDLPKESMFAQ
jgi:uncharacterized protein YdaU (DUF1376 family)